MHLPGRRAFLTGLSSLIAFAGVSGGAGSQTPSRAGRFSHADVVLQAKGLAARPYAPPPAVPETLQKLTYDLYR